MFEFMFVIVYLKGRVGNFKEASNSKLALKAFDPFRVSPKPCLLQITRMHTVEPVTHHVLC